MKRMIWFGLGVAAGVTASRKVSNAAHRLTPAGAAENIGDAVRELAAAIGSFGADVRAGMVEREAQLHATVTGRTGIDVVAPRQTGGSGLSWMSSKGTRARRA
ncbi:MAG: hypothetical protein ACRDTG_32500 [Pseudonocardiaceae bacterium]